MNFIPCVNWIRRGVSKEVPDEIKLEKEDLKRILSGTADDIVELENVDDDHDSSENEEDNGKLSENIEDDDDVEFMAKYDLDNYDDDPQDNADEGDTFASLKSVTCYASNDEDPYITVKEDESDEDEEENKKIKPTDNLIAVGHVDQDTSILEFHIYNEEEENLYVHHDILLPSYPLCVEWLDFDPDDESPGNFIAIGSMLPRIDVWDVNIINTLEPSFTLGKKKKKKKSSNKKAKVEGHTDAVLALSWNKVIKNGLASGSADFTALLWDLKTKKCVTKIKNHKEKVQTLQFHPFEAQTLLTGSCDGTAKLFDCRDTSQGAKSWSFDAEVEKVLWNHFDPYHFIVATETGNMHYMDVRSQVPVFDTKAHSEAISGLSLSSHCPGCLMTVSTDRSFKVWDINNNQAECILEHDFKLGQMYCLSTCPDNPFVIAAGGDNKENNFVVWDIRQFDSVVKRFGDRQLLKVDQQQSANLKSEENDQMDVDCSSSLFSEDNT